MLDEFWLLNKGCYIVDHGLGPWLPSFLWPSDFTLGCVTQGSLFTAVYTWCVSYYTYPHPKNPGIPLQLLSKPELGEHLEESYSLMEYFNYLFVLNWYLLQK